MFEGLSSNAWDICFLAIEPVRAAKISFTEPYILIEGVYLVPPGLGAAQRIGSRPRGHAGRASSSAAPTICS